MTHPKFGERYICFSCGKKFYDLKKTQAICPGCGSDQAQGPKKKVGGGKAVAVAPDPVESHRAAPPSDEMEESDEMLDDRDEEPPYTLDDDGGVEFPDEPEPLTEIDPDGAGEL